MQADTHTLFEYPLGKPLEAKLLKEPEYLVHTYREQLDALLFLCRIHGRKTFSSSNITSKADWWNIIIYINILIIAVQAT